ncbi:MAG: hypothetical protein M1812_004524 [Candelaria pacifica]|nr:MAG: hypothetical protein M1812_004524 [Candelaria pacifica]
MALQNYRTINIDALDPDSPTNFNISTLHPPLPSASAAEIQSLVGQIRQLLRGGDSEGALRGALENAPVGGDKGGKTGGGARAKLRLTQSGDAQEMFGKEHGHG